MLKVGIGRNLALWAFNEGMLGPRMSFVAGPRQVGKTTMVERYLEEHGQSGQSYNWDTPATKQAFARDKVFFVQRLKPGVSPALVAFDESS